MAKKTEDNEPKLKEVWCTIIDAVYKDLIDKRITIGVANQERQMRIQYAKSRFAQILKSETGG